MNIRISKLRTLALLFTLSVHASQALASADAHVHGLSVLTIAMEGKTIEAQLKSPAIDIVGFEHPAQSSTDIQAVESALEQLQDHRGIVSILGGDCQHTHTQTDLLSLRDGSDNKEKHNHSKSHDHPQQNADNSHSEITVTYRYHCNQLSELSAITVKLFDRFPKIHRIKAMWVSASQQGSITLTPKNRVIKFGSIS